MTSPPIANDLVPAIERRATFPATAGNTFRFYHDGAIAADGDAGAFADIEAAILAARHFVFIADWSFHAGVELRRVPGRRSIGELLLHQAHGHPRMLIAIMSWLHISAATGDTGNNRAGDDLRTLNTELGYRSFPKNLLWRASPYGRTNTFSHHQKFVVADVPAEEGQIGAAAFFGGLDLTKGRFDWPDHPLTDTKDGTFADDWYNAEFGDDDAQVRQPWHDVHAHVDGPVAWQIADEFTARWAAPNQYHTLGLSPKGHTSTNAMTRVLEHRAHLDSIRSPRSKAGVNAQLLHSMAREAWQVPAPAAGCGDRFKWPLRKHHERSIQDAYLSMINDAEDFIFIESQYFIGSGAQWGNTRYAAARTSVENEVPKALVNRILRHWRAGKDFHVYIVLPMFPEGDPADIAMRAVRYLQWCTIEYVVNTLATEMDSSETSWDRWISFGFLANWGRGDSVTNEPTGVERFDRVRASHRYMTYLHSKAMIVDDRAAIIGSANLNERSLNGNRDSEIAVAIQDEPTLADLRRGLFTEHLGAAWMQQHGHLEPGSSEAVQAFRDAADATFVDFMNNRGSMANGQLARWPIETNGQRIRFESPSVAHPELIPDAPDDNIEHWTWLADWNAASQFPMAGRLFE